MTPMRNCGFAPALMIVAGLLFWGLTAETSAQSSPPALSYEALADAVDELETRLRRVRGELDQTRFDPEELLIELAFSADDIVAFVNRDIVFHPYEGLLRGYRGTLQARAGNSLDQALLLAYLLKSAGLDARVCRGELDEAQARRLLSLTRAAPTDESSLERANAAVQRAFGDRAPTPPAQVNLDETELAKSSRDNVALLRRSLTAADRLPDATALNAALVNLVRPYFWVEYRQRVGLDWQIAHPAFEGADDVAVEPLEYMAEEIPAEYHHTLTVEAFVRQRRLDEFETHPVMKAYTRPVANLHGRVIAYRNHPSGITPETLTNLEEALQEDQIFTPLWGGSPAPGALAFDLKGRTIDPMALGSEAGGAAGVFATLGDKLESATGTVTDPDDPRTVFTLDAMWLEFTFATLSGEKTVQRRYLLAPAGDAERAPADLLWPLITEYAYVVNAGHVPLDYLADRYLAAGISSLPTYKALAHKLLEPDSGTPVPDRPPSQDFGPEVLYWVMARNPLNEPATISVRHRPAVVGIRNGMRNADTAFAAVDVVANPALQLVKSESGVRHDPDAALALGVWETATETLPARLRTDEAERSASTLNVMSRARDQKIPLRVITSTEALDGMQLDAGTRTMLGHDLEAGYTVVAPERTPQGVAMTGWWRVDPVTGTTLGMTADGHGSSVVEYLIDVTGIAFNLVQAIGGLANCATKTDTVEQMCCLVETHINNVAGLGMGGIMGATVGSAGAALFDIVNFGMQEATAAAFGKENAKGLMPQASLGCEKMAGTGF